MNPDNHVASAIAALGGPAAVARRRGLTPWAVSKWRNGRMPADHICWLAGETQYRYTPHMLDPRLYPYPEDGLPPGVRRGAGSRVAA